MSIPLKGINSLGSSIGNLINENNRKKLKQVFLELFSVTFYITSISSILIYYSILILLNYG